MRVPCFVSALLLLPACHESTEPSPHPSYAISAASAWSGGTVRVSSASLAPGAGTPVFSAAGETLSVARVDDSTFAVTLPIFASGPTALFREGQRRDSIGEVQLSGLHAARKVPGSMGYEPLVPPGLSPLVFVAENFPTGAPGLTMLDPATDQVTTTSGIGPVESSFGILASFQPNRFVVRDSLGQLAVWQLFPTPAFVAAAGVTGAFRHETQLNDTLWLILTSHSWDVSGPGGSIYGGTLSDPLRVAFASTSDRVAIVINSAPTGQVPVLSRTTGDTAFTVELRNVQGADFSPLSDRLYLASRALALGDPDSVVSVAASTGQRLAGTELPAGYSGWALAVDPVTERVYQVADSSGTLELLVYNGTTLGLEGRLGCPGQCGTTEFWSAGLGVDVTAGRIHVAYPGNPIPVITFDRLP
jgi:DNA-binding beta-propeller fold protein YncE